MWVKQYNGLNNSAIDIVSTDDRFAVAGYTDEYGGGGKDMCVMQIDPACVLAPLDNPGDDRVTAIPLEFFDTDSETIDASAVSNPSAQIVTEWDEVGVAPEHHHSANWSFSGMGKWPIRMASLHCDDVRATDPSFILHFM